MKMLIFAVDSHGSQSVLDTEIILLLVSFCEAVALGRGDNKARNTGYLKGVLFCDFCLTQDFQDKICY